MDCQLIPFEPNLKFVLDLKEDLKTKYFEQHEKAKKSLEFFSTSLRTIVTEHQKLLTDNIELSINNEKLQQIINNIESVQQKISSPSKLKPSQIITSSKNCNIELPLSTPVFDIKTKENCDDKEKNNTEENINEYVPIFSSDFNSEIDDENFKNQNSPPSSILNTPTKVKNSPILSKKKRTNSKKNNLSNCSSSNSITSSNDSKMSIMHIACALEKNIPDIDNDSDNESVKEITKECSKIPESTFISNLQSCGDTDKDYKVLSVSKTNYGKSEFAENGKRLRQTMLTLKRVAPLIDISKIDTPEHTNEKSISKFKFANKRCERTNNNRLNHNAKTNKEADNEIKYSEESNIKKFKANDDLVNQSKKAKRKNHNISYDNELIESSPPANEVSKLRNKLINKKPKMDQAKLPACSSISTSKSTLIYSEDHLENKVSQKKCENRENHGIEQIFNVMSNEAQNISGTEGDSKIISGAREISSDDTFFSPAEIRNSTEKEKVNKYKTIPTKRLLLNSFDEVPDKNEKSPDFAYKETPVRKKNCRAQLPGWECRDCKKWYGNMPEEERKKRQNQCSKHRGKYKADVLTPESFWNPVFDDTHNSSSCDDN